MCRDCSWIAFALGLLLFRLDGVAIAHASPPAKHHSDSARIVWEAELREDEAHDESAWSAVAGIEAALEVAEQIAAEAERRWVEMGQDEEKAAQLGRDLQTILTAKFAPDFDTYHEHMTERGMSLDMIAGGFAEMMLEFELYSRSIPELAADAPVDGKIRHIWNNPRERGAAFESVRISSFNAGFGLAGRVNTLEWPYMGAIGQSSLYVPRSGRLSQQEGERLTQTKNSAWVMFEGRFSSGLQTRMRINFYFDADAEVWVPVTTSLGPDRNFRPYPML